MAGLKRLIAAACLALVLASSVHAAPAPAPPAPYQTLYAGMLHLGPIQPANPGWGQTALYKVYVWRNGPLANAWVECWFSGRHGIQSYHCWARTNRAGIASFSMTLPRDWRYRDTWADFNASCSANGVATYWRVKNK